MNGAFLLVIIAAAICACDSRAPAPAPAPATGMSDVGAPRATLRGAPLTQDELPTTHHRIFVANLEGRIAALESTARDAGEEAPAGLHLALARLYKKRFAYGRDYDDLARAIERSDAALRLEPTNPELLVVAADCAVQAHEFARAQDLLSRAETAGASERVRSSIEQEVDWSAGRHEKAEATIRSTAEEDPDVHTLARLAVLERELGNARASERVFEAAEDAISDTNPYTVAWLNYVRGRGLLDAGETERAIVFLRESVERLPELVDGRLHLAEALVAEDPNSAEAREMYRTLAEEGRVEALARMAELAPADERSDYRARAEAAREDVRSRFPRLVESHH